MAINVAGITYRQERIKCGNPTCGKCPHGPYWYAYWHHGPKLKKKYVGKELPPSVYAEFQKTLLEEVGLTQEEKDYLSFGVLVRTGFSAVREAKRRITSMLRLRIANPLNESDREHAKEEMACVQEAFKRLFPGRR